MSHGSLFQALEAESGLICAIGAGGKKSTLYTLLENHPGRAAMTATVFTYEPPRSLQAAVVVDEADRLLGRIRDLEAAHVLYACPAEKAGRLAGPDAETVRTIHREAGFALTLIKADGARMRKLKAPAGHEPSIPDYANRVLVLSSLWAVGQPLSDRIAHRLEQVLECTGQAVGSTITADTIAALYTHPLGLQRNTGDHRLIPVLNMADGPEQQQAG
ncbi:MAG: putative selenium-dependent hydroxylase accessory protein YqeC, partial [Ectothiorhodospiraceae bacterium]|nr:putative selenium-dependent hydroxylase accessory protein YqeC [Ectothiorhodospiraceae bacterium]